MDPRLKWAFQQSARQLVRLGAKFHKWRADTVVKIPELMQDLSKLTNYKWDDKIVNVVTAIVRIWKPFFKWISKTDQNIINNMESKLSMANNNLPTIKQEGKRYQQARREAKEAVQAQRNIKTEQKLDGSEDEMSKKKKKKVLTPEQQANRARAGAKVFNTLLNPLSAIPNNLGYGVARGLEDLAAKKAYNKAMKSFKNSGMSDQQKRKQAMYDNYIRKKIEGENDLGWYNNYPELINGLITPNFMRRKGTTQDYPIAQLGIPSVAGLQLLAVRGGNGQGVVDASINKLLTSLRMANTGAQLYTTLDIDHYIYNVRAALLAIRQLRRVYGMITKFSTLDSNLPQALFTAIELPYDTFKDNSANLRMFLNYSAERLHVITPIKNDLMERSAWLCDYIFKDSDDAKVQYYIPYFSKIYYYDYATSAYKYANLFGSTRPYTDFITEIQALIDNLIAYDRNGIIASDILKAFGPDQMKYFDYIDENYNAPEVYSEEVLQQIQNATVWGAISYTPTDGTAFIQESLKHNFTISATDSALYNAINNIVTNKMINFYKDNIAGIEVVGATRLTYLGEPSTDSNTDIVISAYGTEVLQGLTVVFNYGGVSLGYDRLNWQTFIVNNLISANGISLYQRFMSFWSDFDWAPEMKFIVWEGRDSSGTMVRSITDLSLFDCNNVAKFTTTLQLQDVHNVANMSLYYSPYMIKETRVTKLPEA